MIANSAIIYPNVKLGKNVIVEDLCIIGMSFKGYSMEETIIGDNALIRSGTIIYAGNKIGINFQTGNKVNIREHNIIGNNVSIGTLSAIEHHIKIGNEVRIHSQAFIPEYTLLEDECWIGPNAVLTNSKYPRGINSKELLTGVHVMKKAIIGANSTLLPGVTVGESAFVGAGSVVTKDVTSKTVVAGNPAKFVKNISELPYNIV